MVLSRQDPVNVAWVPARSCFAWRYAVFVQSVCNLLVRGATVFQFLHVRQRGFLTGIVAEALPALTCAGLGAMERRYNIVDSEALSIAKRLMETRVKEFKG